MIHRRRRRERERDGRRKRRLFCRAVVIDTEVKAFNSLILDVTNAAAE